MTVKILGGRKPLLMSYQFSLPKLFVPSVKETVNKVCQFNDLMRKGIYRRQSIRYVNLIRKGIYSNQIVYTVTSFL